MRHPNIVDVTNLDQAEDGTLFIAMEFVPGPSLRTALEQAHGPFSIPRSLDIARDIASGLTAAHALGTVHRDIKPENVLLAPVTGGRERPKILDFGIVAVAESVSRTSLTRGLLLTPNYAAPEQWMEMPAGEMDGRTDLYALGGVLYEMLTGATPFHAHNISGWMKQHLQETPRPPSLFRPDVANWPELDALVLRLLAKDREQRPRDAGELLNLLDSVRGVPAETGRSAYPPRGWGLAETAVEINVQPKPTTDQTQAPPPSPRAISERMVAPQAAVSEKAVPTPPVPPPPQAAISEQSISPPPREQTAEAKSKSVAFSPWAWAALAILVSIALFGAWRILAPHLRPRLEESPLLSLLHSRSRPGINKRSNLRIPRRPTNRPKGRANPRLRNSRTPSHLLQSLPARNYQSLRRRRNPQRHLSLMLPCNQNRRPRRMQRRPPLNPTLPHSRIPQHRSLRHLHSR